MAGHMGAERVTVKVLKVVRIDGEGLIMVKGSVPGANGTDVIIKPTAKARGSRTWN